MLFAAQGQELTAIGYAQLQAELGTAMPTGAGISLSQIEAAVDVDLHRYMPDTQRLGLVGKDIRDASGEHAGVYPHARTVASILYDEIDGLAPGIERVDVYEALRWELLQLNYSRGLGLNGEPRIEPRHIQNHSWAAQRQDDAATTLADGEAYLRRYDYMICRDRVVAINSLFNHPDALLPDLLSYAYNGITVGVSDGDHGAGLTEYDKPGRSKPDLVAPSDSTSYAVPQVSACAALLLETIHTHAATLGSAAFPETIKSLLMAGATKAEFPAWTRSETRPLDALYGAGELNLFNSYHILAGGEFDPGSSGEVGLYGWDHAVVAAGHTHRYFFRAPAGEGISTLSVMLNWNREISNTHPRAFQPEAFVADHDLYLYSSEAYTPSHRLDRSISRVENLEHLYVKNLGVGQFMLEVRSADPGAYALSWRAETLPVLSVIGVTLSEATDQEVISAAVTPGQRYRLEVWTQGAGWNEVARRTARTPTLIFKQPRPAQGSGTYRVRQVFTPSTP